MLFFTTLVAKYICSYFVFTTQFKSDKLLLLMAYSTNIYVIWNVQGDPK